MKHDGVQGCARRCQQLRQCTECLNRTSRANNRKSVSRSIPPCCTSRNFVKGVRRLFQPLQESCSSPTWWDSGGKLVDFFMAQKQERSTVLPARVE